MVKNLPVAPCCNALMIPLLEVLTVKRLRPHLVLQGLSAAPVDGLLHTSQSIPLVKRRPHKKRLKHFKNEYPPPDSSKSGDPSQSFFFQM